jgi:Na+/H+ antiporter NhaD/arsenite permease-like protein
MPSLSLATSDQKEPEFLQKMRNFESMESAQNITGVWDKISFRAKEEPFLAIASVIFLLAIFHTFLAIPITKYAHKVQHEHDEKIKKNATDGSAMPEEQRMVSFKGTILHFFGEVEAVFGIWVIALIAVMVAFYDKAAVEYYIGHTVNFTEPLFVFVIMAIASTRPVLRFAESCMSCVAALGKNTPAAWWLTILIIAPILGSFITEPGAMTIAAMLLARKFYVLNPSPKFAYATLGLLFVNVSIGGVLTHFAAPPVIMVAKPWGLTTSEMFLHYGVKAVLAITVSSLVYFLMFRKELKAMASNRIADTDQDGVCDWKDRTDDIPLIITISHLIFMAWTVLTAHTPGLFMGGFLFFLAFKKATQHHQNPIDLRSPILVGFFLAALVTHGGLQGWWLAPIIGALTEWPLFFGATVLTGFNDNAAITFLASQVNGLGPALKYAVLAGAVTGGGLTVIANAPNPAGQSILSRFFGDGVSPLKLLIAALLPTLITIVFLKVIKDDGANQIFEMPAKEAAAETPAH